MNKIILFLLVMTIGLSAQAFPWQNFISQPYQSGIPAQPTQPGFSTIQQPYGQTYNPGYYQNPYQAQYQQQYVNPYPYQNQYGYANPYTVVNPTTSGANNTAGTSQVMKNIGQSVLYSMMRGY